MSVRSQKRLAFITGEFPKPSEVFILRELRVLRERGLDFLVVATAKLPDVPESEGIDAEVLLRPRFFSLKSLVAEVRFCLTHPVRYFAMLVQLYRGHWRNLRELVQVLVNFPRALAIGYELRRRGVTRVHALWANLPATLGWVIARGLKMEFSYAAHAWDVYVGGRMLREKTRLARSVVLCNEAAADRLASVVGERLARKITLNRHGLDHDSLPARAASPGDVILAAGRFEPKKGFDVLIRACGILATRGRNVRCAIVGDGKLKGKLARLIAEAGSGGVELRPWMPHETLMQQVAEAAVVVSPSVVPRTGDRDGIPNILLEAMSIGTPVVASNVGGINEVVVDGETGILIPPGDPRALADAIGRILDENRENAAITERAKVLIRQEFTLSENVEKLHRILTE